MMLKWLTIDKMPMGSIAADKNWASTSIRNDD